MQCDAKNQIVERRMRRLGGMWRCDNGKSWWYPLAVLVVMGLVTRKMRRDTVSRVVHLFVKKQGRECVGSIEA